MKLPNEETIIRRLSKIYGFSFPKAFAPLVQIALEAGKQEDYFDVDTFVSYYTGRLGFVAAIGAVLPKAVRGYIEPRLPFRYPQTVPEYFVFGKLGMDGVSYGYLVHAPELELEDYPIVEEQPSVNDGLVPFGNNTAQGLEGIYSQELFHWSEYAANNDISSYEPNWVRIIPQLVERYGIAPSADKAPNYEIRYIPPIPDSWHFEPSKDGVGVLAPSKYFASYPAIFAKWGESPEAVFASAREALAQGYPATALLSLRETFYRQWSAQNKAELKILFKLWEQSYFALDRPLFAKIVKRMRKL